MYPDVADIYTTAQEASVDPTEVFAYAAIHGALPSAGQLAAFGISVGTLAAQLNTQPVYIYAYATANRNLPNGSQFTNYATNNGWVVNGIYTGITPAAGDGYQQGTGAAATAAPPTQPVNTSGNPISDFTASPIVQWIESNPIITGVAVIGGIIGAKKLGIF